jgi:hypothetical protein
MFLKQSSLENMQYVISNAVFSIVIAVEVNKFVTCLAFLQVVNYGVLA